MLKIQMTQWSRGTATREFASGVSRARIAGLVQRDPWNLRSKCWCFIFVIALAWNPPKNVKPCEVGRKQNPGKLCLEEGSVFCLGGFSA